MAVFARAVMMLAENKVPLARDVIFLAEADEEGGPPTTRSWLARTHWPKIDCEFALNEGGWIIKGRDGRVQYVSISTADKLSLPIDDDGARHLDALVDAAARQRHLRAVAGAGEAGRSRDRRSKLHAEHAAVLPDAREDQQRADVATHFRNLTRQRSGARASGGPRNQQGSPAARDHAATRSHRSS